MGRRKFKIPYQIFSNVMAIIEASEYEKPLSPYYAITLRQNDEGRTDEISFPLDGSSEQIQFLTRALDVSIQVYNRHNNKLVSSLEKITKLDEPLEVKK